MESIWSKTVQFAPRGTLPGDIRAEAAVIGAGLTGCLAAYFLQRQGVGTVVLEAGRIGSGQTKNTTAKITSQHGLIYDRLIKTFGHDQARLYAAANQHAIEKYRSLIRGNAIDCDFEERPAYLYTSTAPGSLQTEWKAADSLGIPAKLTTATSLPFPVAEALCFENQAQFHPLKFLRAISQELTVYENTRVLEVEGGSVVTDRGKVWADCVVFACHFPFVNVPGCYFARMHQDRSYVLALENAQTLDGMYLGTDIDGLSFRMAGPLLLLGGAGHRTGENALGGRYERLRRAARTWWPDSRETACWSAQDCMPADGMPYIGRYARARPNWYVATGFRKWGMTSSMAAAMILCDAVLGRENEYAGLFSPQRPIGRGPVLKSLAADGIKSVKNLCRSVFVFPDKSAADLPAGHGGVVELEGRKAGVYKDAAGAEHAVDARCPHLGCELSWNPDDSTWDCPCHGSRFDQDGGLLSGPAQTDIVLEE